MDPDAALAEIRAMIADTYQESDGTPDQVDLEPIRPAGTKWRACENNPQRFYDLVEGLDDWIASGGALPRAWVEMPR